MNLLVSVENFYPPHGGAELSFKTLFSELSKKHDVKIVCAGPKERELQWQGMTVAQYKVKAHSADVLSVVAGYSESLLKQLVKNLSSNQIIKDINRNSYWESVLKEEIEDFQPQIIFTQLNFIPATVKTAVRSNIPTVVFLRSYEHLCPLGFSVKGPKCDKNCAKCFKFNIKLLNPALTKANLVFAKKLREQYRTALKEANCLISNSLFMSKLTKEWLGVKSKVVYPIIDKMAFKALKKSHTKLSSTNIDETNKNISKFILFVKPTKAKGAGIIVELVRKMPMRKFLVIGKGESKYIEELKEESNVKYISWCSKMDTVYENTRLLLIPSQWPEPFGRVAVEAGYNGIPTLASTSGGLPEAVGSGGKLIQKHTQVEPWQKAILDLDEQQLYQTLSQKAKKNAEKFNFENIFQSFKNVIEEDLDIKL